VLTVVRALRLLRIFRVLKLVRFVREAQTLGRALAASGRKITVFLGVVLTLVLILGTVLYFLEGDLGQFSSIPQGMYWAIVTMTTVGYGDVVPQTVAGKVLASVAMILGYGVIAVPTGIVSAELVSSAQASRPPSITTRTCPVCVGQGHEADARYCKHCGGLLADPAVLR
jgi:voltage-gated potassium channel